VAGVRPRGFSFTLFAAALSIAAPAALLIDAKAPGGGPPQAQAAVSVLLSLGELVGASTHVVVATAGERRSAWEDLPGGRRIVTYTRFKIERAIGASPGEEIEVRTLGGVVGQVGQAVSGDAKIAKGERALLFLKKADRAFVVAGLAQGHFPVRADAKGTPRLAPSPDAGSLLARRGPAISAREELVGTTIDDAAAAVDRARRARDAR
jgi:hypothetical protein